MFQLRVETRKVGELRPYERNSKLHPQSQIESIKASIQRFGFNDPIGVTEDGTVVEGHGRLTAAFQLGLMEVPVIVLPATMTDDMIDLYRIAHNKIALNSTFDFGALVEQLREIVAGSNVQFADMGFDQKTVEGMFEQFGGDSITTGSGAGESYTEAGLDFEIVWDSAEQRDKFKAFTQKVRNTYGGDEGRALADLMSDVVNGKLVPTGIVEAPATAENVGDLSWDR